MLVGCTERRMITNYEKHAEDIWELKDFYSSTFPDSLGFYIVFYTDSTFTIAIKPYNQYVKHSYPFDNGSFYLQTNVKYEDIAEVMNIYDIKKEQIDSLYQSLKKVNCCSIDSRPFYFEENSLRIGYYITNPFQLNGYNYVLLTKKTSDETIDEFSFLHLTKINDSTIIEFTKWL